MELQAAVNRFFREASDQECPVIHGDGKVETIWRESETCHVSRDEVGEFGRGKWGKVEGHDVNKKQGVLVVRFYEGVEV